MSSNSSKSTPSSAPVLLPPRSKTVSDSVRLNPVWKLKEEDDSTLLVGCGKTDGTKGSCCADAKQEDRAHLIDPDIVRDLVIGLSDGLTVPFALTAGLSVLGSTKFVVTAGLAELISGAFSMGIGGFLAAQSDRAQFLYLTRATEIRLQSACASELRRETFGILAPLGLDASVSAAVADSLQRIEGETRGEANVKPKGFKEYLVGRIGDRPGMTTFLIKHGEGMTETTRLRMLLSGITVGVGYLLGGIIPMIPYFIIKDSVLLALFWSIGVTVLSLLIFGGLKAYYTGAGQGPWGVIYGAVSTCAIGASAAAAAYGVVKALNASS